MKRQALIFFIILALFIAACDSDNGGEDFVEPTRPTLTISNGDVSVNGQLLNICWPKGTGNVSCEPTFGDAAPTETLPVTANSQITISVGEADAPDRLVVIGSNPAGEVLYSQTFWRGESPSFPIDSFGSNLSELEITAYYDNLQESEAVVSSVFAVEMAGAVAVDQTPDATDDVPPTEAATAEPTEEATAAVETEMPTEEATPVADTEVPTAESTEDMTAAVETEMPTEEAMAESTEESTPAADTEVPTTESTEEPAETATDEVGISEAPTEETTMTVTEEATEIETSPTVEPPPPTEPGAVDTSAPPTPTIFAPSATAAAPAGSPTPFVPSATPSATVMAPTPTTTPFPPPTSVGDEEVGINLRISGQDHTPVGYETCQVIEDESVCEQFVSDDPPQRPQITRGRSAVAEISGDDVPMFITYQILESGILNIMAGNYVEDDNVISFRVNLPADVYLLSIEVVWPDTSVTYFYDIQIIE